MRENAKIFGGFRGIGLSQPRARITGKAPTCRKRQIEGCLDPNRRPSGECRLRCLKTPPLRLSASIAGYLHIWILRAPFVERYT